MSPETLIADPVYVRSDLPPGRAGDWELEIFKVDEPRQPDTRPQWCRSEGGRYRRLKRRAEVFMTDLKEEWWTQRSGIAEACRRGGDVLVTGLGLGMVAESMFQTPGSRVETVTVIEASPDVVALVADHLRSKYPGRLRIHEADAFEWDPPSGECFTVAWHDIWPNPHDESRWGEMEELERRYAPCCEWQGCWVRDYLLQEREFEQLQHKSR